MKDTFKGMGDVLFCLFEVIVGILLFINPAEFTMGILMAIGVALLVAGVCNIVKYFRLEPELATTGQYIFKGLIALLAGAFCAFRAGWFMETVPALTLIYGVILLLIGLAKVQTTIDMARRKAETWYLPLICAAISIVCSVIVLNSSFDSNDTLWLFTGFALVIDAIIDLVTITTDRRGAKKDKKDNDKDEDEEKKQLEEGLKDAENEEDPAEE